MSNTIINKLEKVYKQSSINTFKRQLKIIGITQYIEENFKGKIKELITKIQEQNLKNDKIYYNAIRAFYKVCDYDEDEMDLLENQYIQKCKVCDEKRLESKLGENTEYINICLWELQIIRDIYKDKYKALGLFSDLINWLIASLYCDEDFAPKRPIDIIKLRRDNINIENRTISFRAQKNNFNYTSNYLSDAIWEPLMLIYEKKYKNHLLLNMNLSVFTTESFNYRFKQIFKGLDINPQKTRRVWASYKWISCKHPKQIIDDAYNLNHGVDAHLVNYIQPYRDYKIIKTIKK